MAYRNCWNRCNLTLLFFLAFALCLAGYKTPATASSSAGAGLLGSTPSQVIDRLGAPASVGCGNCGYYFVYPSETGEPGPTIQFHDDCAYWVNPAFKGQAAGKPLPTNGIYPGQPVHELVEKLGQPEEILHGQLMLTLEYKKGMVITIAHGLVLSIEG